MTQFQALGYAAKRDFWLCLARAFAPPAAETYRDSFCKDLPEDLFAITTEIGAKVDGDIEAFAKEAAKLPDSLEIQRLYAALFVTPPTPAFMNTAIYLDGAFLGGSEFDIQQWYARHGFERHEGFRDLNDHAAVQMEFLGQLFDRASTFARSSDDIAALALATEAGRFIHTYVRQWIGPFLHSIQEACRERDLNAAFVHLARIVWSMVDYEIEHGTARFEVEAERPLPNGSSRGIGDVTAEDLAEIALRLQSAGLSFDHIREQEAWSETVFNQHLSAQSGAMAQ